MFLAVWVSKVGINLPIFVWITKYSFNATLLFHFQTENKILYQREFKSLLLNNAAIVCCTLNSSGSSVMDVLTQRTERTKPFTCLIVDEVSNTLVVWKYLLPVYCHVPVFHDISLCFMFYHDMHWNAMTEKCFNNHQNFWWCIVIQTKMQITILRGIPYF